MKMYNKIIEKLANQVHDTMLLNNSKTFANLITPFIKIRDDQLKYNNESFLFDKKQIKFYLDFLEFCQEKNLALLVIKSDNANFYYKDISKKYKHLLDSFENLICDYHNEYLFLIILNSLYSQNVILNYLAKNDQAIIYSITDKYIYNLTLETIQKSNYTIDDFHLLGKLIDFEQENIALALLLFEIKQYSNEKFNSLFNDLTSNFVNSIYKELVKPSIGIKYKDPIKDLAKYITKQNIYNLELPFAFIYFKEILNKGDFYWTII